MSGEFFPNRLACQVSRPALSSRDNKPCQMRRSEYKKTRMDEVFLFLRQVVKASAQTRACLTSPSLISSSWRSPMTKARIPTWPPPIPEIAWDPEAVTTGVQAAARAAVSRLHDAGLPAFSFRDGRVVEVSPPKSK